MDIQGKVVVVTGGASGIGLALCQAFARAGARGVVVADLDAARCDAVAADLDALGVLPHRIDAGGAQPALGLGIATNVADADAVQRLVDQATARFGQVDIFCANAGVLSRRDLDAPLADWQRHWDVNVMGQVHAARAVLPQMLARGAGYFVTTASAAGLLSQVNAAPYSVTKHAAVGFAEWLAIAHGDQGLRVSCLCPQGVDTPMMRSAEPDGSGRSFLADGALSPAAVAQAVLGAIRDERFLILPHAEVLTFWQRKTADVDRWLRGMRRLRAKVMGADAA